MLMTLFLSSIKDLHWWVALLPVLSTLYPTVNMLWLYKLMSQSLVGVESWETIAQEVIGLLQSLFHVI